MNSPVLALNRLRTANSPYLLAHADNPIDWYPWGTEALERARREGKPILLSIGYAACHWCHVMEHESFRDESIAALMNENFVCIKVDREERPDIDEVYMTATVALTGHGGWPMTVFLTPDCNPFYAGTYFPPDDRFGRPGFRNVLRTIAEVWQKNRQRIVDEGEHVTEQLRAMVAPTPAEPIAVNLIDTAIVQLRANFDGQFGGFGDAPKFPPHAALRLLADAYLRGGTADCLDMAVTTLKHIQKGGIHDQLGGGFARYSTDKFWHVPHFEKMLYDNAQLAKAYLFAYRQTNHERYRATLESLFDWVKSEMTSPDGGFYTAIDADSEGQEGLFYTFTWDQVQETLDSDEIELACRHFDIRPEGNWEGTNVLWAPASSHPLAAELGLTETALAAQLETIKAKLRERRSSRPRPLTDDKILAGNTGLMLSALAVAGRVLGKQEYIATAERAALFIIEQMLTEDGRLVRVFRKGSRSGDAMLEDYAYVSEALLDLYEATGTAKYLRQAESLANCMLADFFDASAGRLYHARVDTQPIPLRIAESHDGPSPNATAVAAVVLAKLSVFLDRPEWRNRASSVLAAHGKAVARIPRGHCDLLRAARYCESPLISLVLVPGENQPANETLWEACRTTLDASTLLSRLPQAAGAAEFELPLFAGRVNGNSKPAVYVCRDETCSLPVHTKEDLHQLLSDVAQNRA